MKTSQTWLASHTGPIEWSITSRGRSPRSAPPATRSQKPAPKSAPPNTAYAVTATNSRTATAVLTAPTPVPRSALGRAEVGVARPVGDLVLGNITLAEAPAHQPQDQHRRDRQPDVQDGDADERDPDTGVAGGRLLDLHVVVDDPRLAADLADHPAGLHRHHRRDTGARGDAQEPAALRHVPSEQPATARTRRRAGRAASRDRPSRPRPGARC